MRHLKWGTAVYLVTKWVSALKCGQPEINHMAATRVCFVSGTTALVSTIGPTEKSGNKLDTHNLKNKSRIFPFIHLQWKRKKTIETSWDSWATMLKHLIILPMIAQWQWRPSLVYIIPQYIFRSKYSQISSWILQKPYKNSHAIGSNEI